MQINLISPSSKKAHDRIGGLHPHFTKTIISIWLLIMGGTLILTLLTVLAQENLKTVQTKLLKNNEIINKKVHLEQLIAQYETKEQLIHKQDQSKILWSKVLYDLDIIFGINGFSPKDKAPRPLVTITGLGITEERPDNTYEITIEGHANSFQDLSIIQRNLQGYTVESEDKKKLFKYQNSKIILGEILEDPKTLAKVFSFKLVVVIPKEVIKK